jgi:hypothetical protein
MDTVAGRTWVPGGGFSDREALREIEAVLTEIHNRLSTVGVERGSAVFFLLAALRHRCGES